MNNQTRLVITGISCDLGAVIARAISSDPESQIIGTMRRKATSADKFPHNVHVIDDCDLTQPDSCERVAAAAARFSGPFGFVHSVGNFLGHTQFLDFAVAKAAEEWASNVTSLYNTLHCLIPIMQKHREGSCIAFSCNSVRYSYPQMASFTASKSAVESLMKSLANEFSGDGLRFNSLMLATLKTEKEHEAKPHGDFQNFVPPKDIVPVIRFLLSPESYLVNGNVISLFRHSESFFRNSYFERIKK